MPRRFPVLVRLTLPFVLLVLLGATTLVSYYVSSITRSLKRGAAEKLAAASHLIQEAASGEGDRLLLIGNSALSIPGVSDLISRRKPEELLPLLLPSLASERFQLCSVLDGSLSPLMTLSPLGDEPGFRNLPAIRRMKLGIGGVGVSRIGGSTILLAASPNRTAGSAFDGGVVVGIDFGTLVHRLTAGTNIGVVGYDQAGTPDAFTPGMKEAGFIPSPGDLDRTGGGAHLSREWTSAAGERYLVHLAPLAVGSDLEGTLATLESMDGIMMARRNYIVSVVILSVIGISLIIAIGYFVARSVTVPINDLLGAFRMVEQGDFGVALPPGGRDELAHLTASFNRMVGRLRDEMLLLQQSLLEVQAASEIKGRFVATVSHELRTPLSVIIGYVSLMHDGTIGKAPPEFLQMLEVVKRRAEELYRLIENILVVSRVEGGEPIRPTPEEMAPDRLVADVVDELSLVASDKGVAVSVEGSYGRCFVSDGRLLREILVNLIANAIKFTPKGGAVTVRVAGGGRGETELIVSVADNGIGIPTDQLERIFDPFYQIDSSVQRAYGGTGLGLFIVREMAQILGGAVSVKSEPGKGSVFTVTIPPAPSTGS